MFIRSLQNTKVDSINLGKGCFHTYSLGYAPNSGGCWTGDLIIVDWHDIENYVQKLESRNSREHFIIPCAGGSARQ